MAKNTKTKNKKRPLVVVTRLIPDAGIKLLKKYCRVKINPQNRQLTPNELKKFVKGADAILSLLNDLIDKKVLVAAGQQLKIVANYAVGFDNINIKDARAARIYVTNTPNEEIIQTVAEHAFALMIALAHRLVESDNYARAEKYKGWDPLLFLGVDLYGKTLGIVGLGNIGKAVAQRAVKGFMMKALYYDVKRDRGFEKEFGAKYVSLKQLLKQSDFITLHVPLIPATKHLISYPEFKLMKKTAFLVNTARGPVVDEKALLKALGTKKIAGAGLDVYECEPAIDCDIRDNLELKAFPNVVLTPHTASATIETRQKMSEVAAVNILDVLIRHKKPRNLVA